MFLINSPVSPALLEIKWILRTIDLGGLKDFFTLLQGTGPQGNQLPVCVHFNIFSPPKIAQPND